MDSEFPDPDDEFDVIHEEDYEVLRDFEGNGVKNVLTPVDRNSQSNCVQPSQPVQATPLNCLGSAAVPQPSQNGFVCSVDNNKKRTFEELFGDISDLIENDNFSDFEGPKEKRPRWNQPDEIIEAILAAKRNLCEKNNHASGPAAATFVNKQKDSISLRIPSWNFVAVTRCVDGQRLYVRVRETSRYAATKNRSISGFLPVSYSQLKAEAEEIIIKNAKRASLPPPVPTADDAPVEDELWVNKYRPRKYMELLSDDSVNRAFLHWLKLWDKVVFNRETIKPRKSKKTPQFGTKKFINNKDTAEVDKKGFPVYRIALLSGPPGLGKTTLAHVAARHAGYNVVEVNASDDRGPDAFRQALLASTQMKAVMGANPKPNCLILDEIDGAPVASIDILLKFIHGKLISKSKKINKEKLDKEPVGCRRPIVCICNEAYTPSLRALRLIALIIPVPGIAASRLADRLLDIAQKEKITADPHALLQLAERSGCDVRACLGALQYMGRAKVGENLTLGLKDCRKGLFDSWREILQIPMNSTGPLPLHERAMNILKAVQGGETDRLVQGIFHNYPTIRNDKMNVVSGSLEWFEFLDEMTTYVMTYQTWALMPYTNYAFVAWHLNLASVQIPKLSYPSVTREVKQKLTRSIAILTASQRASGRDILTLTLDIAPLLPELLTPRLRSVSSHLYSTKEKSDLAHLVDVMLDLGLVFVQDINFEGSYEYNLEPNLFEVGIFPECKVRQSLSYPVKQVVILELEAERLRRADRDAANVASKSNVQGKESSNDDSKIVEKYERSTSPETEAKVSTVSSATSNNLKGSKSIASQFSPEMECRDFFGRLITRDNQRQSSTSTSPRTEISSLRFREALTKNRIWYKYKEGFSNAVRRKVTMKDLL